jgi:hypothetical protein
MKIARETQTMMRKMMTREMRDTLGAHGPPKFLRGGVSPP